MRLAIIFPNWESKPTDSEAGSKLRVPEPWVGPNVTPTAPYALYAARGGGPGGLTIIAILDLLGGAAQCMVAAGPNAWDSVPATDACKWMALYGGLCDESSARV